MKMLKTTNEIKLILKEPRKIILYGAGWAGKEVHDFLVSNNAKIYSFAITISNKHTELKGIPVYSIDDIQRNNRLEECTIILAVTKSNQYAMERELEKRNIYSYFVLSNMLFYKILNENRKINAKKACINKEIVEDKKRVGYLIPGYWDSDYAEKRLIVGRIENSFYMAIPKETMEINWEDTRYENRPDSYRQLMEACYCPSQFIPEVDLIHTFNTVCNTDQPWCASFETSMPRIVRESEKEKEYHKRLVDYMKKPNCKALYPLSQNAYDIQKRILMECLPSEDVELLMEKTEVLHPPQQILISREEFEKKHASKKIHFIFVGRAFFFKGGREVIQVLGEFAGQYDFDLTLISSLQYDDYFTKTPYEEMLRCKKIISESPWIKYYESLPNEEVLLKCKEATVGLLPSVADTYGYAVLEMQAAGCPVITTNIRAFPETNNGTCGWICQVPVDRLGFCAERKTEIWSEILMRELRSCFEDIFNHPENIKRKGKAAVERIRKMHDPYAYQERLRRIL